jgi:Na+/proline symporter
VNITAIGWGLIGFLIFFIIVSFAVKGRISNLTDFWIVGRKGKWYFYACTLAAGYVSMWTFVAGVGTAWSWGPTPTLLFYTSSLTFGWILVTMIIGLRLRKLGYMTITEFYRDRFAGEKDNALITGIGVALAGTTFFYLLIQIKGSAIIVSTVFGMNLYYAIAIIIIVQIAALWMSGMWSVVVTDMFTNVIFVIVAVCVLPVTIMSVGGRDIAINAVSEAGIWSSTGASGLDMSYFVGYALAWLAIIGGSPHLINLTLILEERKSVFKGTIVAFTMVIILSVCLFLTGAVLNAAIPHADGIALDSITPLAAKSVWPTWLGILVLGGAMSAAYTTASSQVMTTSLGVVDIFRFLKKERPDDKILIRYTKICALAVLLVVGVVAGTDLWIMAIASSLAGVVSSLGIFPTLLVSVYWKGVTRAATKIMLWISVPVGLFMIICNTAYGWFAPFPTVYSYPIGFGGLILLSLLTKQDNSEKVAAVRFKDIAFVSEKIVIQKVDYIILACALIAATCVYFTIINLIGISV